jgi:hypothetical protein
MTEKPLETLCRQKTATSLNLPADLPLAEWLKIGKALCRTESSFQWYVADWWAFGEHRYGERKQAAEGITCR